MAVETARGVAENREMNKNNDLKAFFSWFSAFLSADAQLSQCSWLPDKCGKISQFELVVSSPGTEAQINEGLSQVWQLIFPSAPERVEPARGLPAFESSLVPSSDRGDLGGTMFIHSPSSPSSPSSQHVELSSANSVKRL